MSQVVRPDPLDRTFLLLLLEQRVRAEVGRLVPRRHRPRGRLVPASRRKVFGHGVFELFYGVRVGRGRPLVGAVRLRRTGRQRGLTRRRGGAQAGEMRFPARHRRVLIGTAAAAVCRRRHCLVSGQNFGDFPLVRFPLVVAARLLRLYSYAVVVVIQL